MGDPACWLDRICRTCGRVPDDDSGGPCAGCGTIWPRRRYTTTEEDSARWDDVRLRAGDLVVSTRSKHGTTWLQVILLLLIHRAPLLPAPLVELSPWLDHLVEPLDDALARLDTQTHRRVIKTHTPLDGIPLHAHVTYVVVARDPLDAAVSLYHQGDNLDFARFRDLSGAAHPRDGGAAPRMDLRAWLRHWIEEDADPFGAMDSLPGVAHHLSDAWSRRSAENVTLVRYSDLLADRDGEMRRLADRLDLAVPPGDWAALVAAAGFEAMRGQAADLAPDRVGVLRDRTAFFRRGSAGAAADLLDAADLALYRARIASLVPPDLLAWLHR